MDTDTIKLNFLNDVFYIKEDLIKYLFETTFYDSETLISGGHGNSCVCIHKSIVYEVDLYQHDLFFTGIIYDAENIAHFIKQLQELLDDFKLCSCRHIFSLQSSRNGMCSNCRHISNSGMIVDIDDVCTICTNPLKDEFSKRICANNHFIHCDCVLELYKFTFIIEDMKCPLCREPIGVFNNSNHNEE